MSQEEAMEQYLALVSKEIPGLTKAGHTVSCLILRVWISPGCFNGFWGLRNFWLCSLNR